jgi:hypothetical protein
MILKCKQNIVFSSAIIHAIFSPIFINSLAVYFSN